MCLKMNARTFFAMLKEGAKQERVDSNRFLVDVFDIVALTQASKTEYLTDTRAVFTDRINRDLGVSTAPAFVEPKKYKSKAELDLEAQKFMGMALKFMKVKGADVRRQ